MPACPHCAENIEKLPGFVSEATLKERLKNQATAKDGEITALTTEVTALRTKTEGHDAIVLERDKYRTELEGVRRREERLGVLDELKLDRGLLEHVEVLYNSATAGVEEPPEFKAWATEHGKAHPLLAPHFGKAAGATNGDQGNQQKKLPDAGDSADPAGPGGKMTPMDLQAYFASPEYAALDRDAKKAKIAELKGQTKAVDT